jgi:hypothetical protein
MYLRNSREKGIVISEGRDCFPIFHKRLYYKIFEQHSVDYRTEPNTADILDTKNGYNLFFEANQNYLGHYFRNLYHIVKYIDKSEIDNKKVYTNFVRAQLSSHELALIFYNCLSQHGSEKFKPLIEKYALLKNINKELIFNQIHLSEYQNSAYGK